jgi:L-seryl-tRNA(Ser) seleniumtransferase
MPFTGQTVSRYHRGPMDKQFSPLPSLQSLLRLPTIAALIAEFGRVTVVEALRKALELFREERRFHLPLSEILDAVTDILTHQFAVSERSVFNMTGTVSHTNLGRAQLPEAAIAAAVVAHQGPTNLEFDLADGHRGERDSHVSGLLTHLTGAEGATVVNNNAAAIVLALSTLAQGKHVVVSRGELIEIGGSFRIPDIINSSGATLREVGTTNRTHPRDYRDASSAGAGAIMRVHQANYSISGFTASVSTSELAAISNHAGLPFLVDLGSGSLFDLEQWGLPHEPTPREALLAGASLVTFSGDKLFGGPQAGLIVGRADLISQLNANPLKRAMRLDKGRLAALEAVLRQYLEPVRLAERLPALRLLTRAETDIEATANRIAPGLAAAWPDHEVAIVACRSQIGSGAMPIDFLSSTAVTFRGATLVTLARALRALPRPVLGRLHEGRLWLDCRCLEPSDEAEFLCQLPEPARGLAF